MKTISKSKLKPQMLKIFREIELTGEELIVTDHGKAVLKISPHLRSSQDTSDQLKNSVVKYDNPFESVSENDWDLLQ
jgi:antitoxin (DNA-binding transcriptional repressor) of toxin-antitoxin stability system